jgi:hypothetical protein
MKTTAKKLTTFGNIGLVQIKVEPETTFAFKPGSPEIQTGGLVISEASGEGVVGKLVALNNTTSFLLLTDADILTGAKQNRIINKSILLAPMSKTIVEVSCIERLRWQYKERNFKSPGTIADHDLRREKASAMGFKTSKPGEIQMGTQSAVWSHVSRKLKNTGYTNRTESYSDLIGYRMLLADKYFPACDPEKGCNGIAVLIDNNVAGIDIFGTEEVYIHYFSKIRDSAFTIAQRGKNIKPVDIHEAYYKVLDTLDKYEKAERYPEPAYKGAGELCIADCKELVGFDLTIEKQMIHSVLFTK